MRIKYCYEVRYIFGLWNSSIRVFCSYMRKRFSGNLSRFFCIGWIYYPITTRPIGIVCTQQTFLKLAWKYLHNFVICKTLREHVKKLDIPLRGGGRSDPRQLKNAFFHFSSFRCIAFFQGPLMIFLMPFSV